MNIILGGTSGLGHEISRGLQARSEETFVIGRSYNPAEHGNGMKVDLLKTAEIDDLQQYIQNIGETTLKRFFWVAGFGYNGDFAIQENVQDMALANFAHVLPLAQTIWEKMLAQMEPTNFIVVSSTTGEKARADEAVYAATKHAQVGFARSLGMESQRLKASMRVALFLPGGMKTPFWDGKEPEGYETFLDPKKVSVRILDRVFEQTTPMYEETIPKGSL